MYKDKTIKIRDEINKNFTVIVELYTNTIPVSNELVTPTAKPKGQNDGDIFERLETFSCVFFFIINLLL